MLVTLAGVVHKPSRLILIVYHMLLVNCKLRGMMKVSRMSDNMNTRDTLPLSTLKSKRALRA